MTHLIWDLFGWTVLTAALVFVSTRFEDIARWSADKAHEAASASATGSAGQNPEGGAATNHDGVELKPDRLGQYHTWVEINGSRCVARPSSMPAA